MKIYEIRGFDIRERNVREKLEVLVFVLSSNRTNFIKFQTRDGLLAICYTDFTNNLVVVTD